MMIGFSHCIMLSSLRFLWSWLAYMTRYHILSNHLDLWFFPLQKHILALLDVLFPDDYVFLIILLVPLQDVSASLSMKYPELYMDGIRDVFFKWRVVAIRAVLSVYQSLIFFYFVSASSLSAKNSDGKIFGLWDVSTMAFTCVVVTVNFRLLMNCNSITRWHYISVGGSILGWFLFVFLYSGIRTRYDRQVNFLFIGEYTLVFSLLSFGHN